jgi:hypothetical protein
MAREGSLCGCLASETCSDCDCALCKPHAESCNLCLKVFFCCCPFFQSREAHAGGATLHAKRNTKGDLRNPVELMLSSEHLTSGLYDLRCEAEKTRKLESVRSSALRGFVRHLAGGHKEHLPDPWVVARKVSLCAYSQKGACSLKMPSMPQSKFSQPPPLVGDLALR